MKGIKDDEHKMSCLSDIDLATLHQLRLNERVQYKLSWRNRQTDVQLHRNVEHQQRQQQPKTKVQVDQRRSYSDRKANITTTNACVEPIKKSNVAQSDCQIENNVPDSKTTKHHSIAIPSPHKFDYNGNRLCDKVINDVVNESAIADDDDFPTLRRRRSGTWP